MNVIYQRRSIRKYTDEHVSDEKIKEILRAGMNAPSAKNQQPWEFIVVRDMSRFEKLMEVHQYSRMINESNAAIIVCGNTEKTGVKDYWIQDCAAATQNILLEIENQGLGGVWLGITPMEERVKAIKESFNVNEPLEPFSVIVFGYKGEEKPANDNFHEDKIHYEVIK